MFLLTNRYKQKPIDKVLAEIDRVRELWHQPFLGFADDNSFVRKDYWKALLSRLARRRTRWFTETDLSVADDPDLLRLMRGAGCKQVLVGLESPVVEGLKGLELRADWKYKKLPYYREAVRRIQSQGIRVNGCFVLGLDGRVTLQTPFPGTPIYQNLLRSGRLIEERAWHKCTLFDLVYEPKPMTREELTEGFRNLVARLYSEDATNWRRENFKRKYLGNVVKKPGTLPV